MRLLLITFCFMAIGASCQQEVEPEVSIEEMEREVQQGEELDTALARRITDAYIKYAETNPEDSLTPHYLMRAADIYKEMPRKGLKAVNVYNRVLNEYSEHQVAPRALFMMGYVFDEKYNDADRAIKTYSHFLEKYPEHPLSEDAKNLLVLMQDTISEEEQVARWLQEAENETNQKNE